MHGYSSTFKQTHLNQLEFVQPDLNQQIDKVQWVLFALFIKWMLLVNYILWYHFKHLPLKAS